MTTELSLWWQVRERLAAQAWSCDDATWQMAFNAHTVGSLLGSYADPSAESRPEVSRNLQALSEGRDDLEGDLAPSIVRAWLTLRQIDAALGRPPIDLRSEVALFVGQQLVDVLQRLADDVDSGLTLRISGPGFLSSTSTPGRTHCTATMSWPTLVGLAAGTVLLEDSPIDLAGDDGAIDAFIDTLVALPTTVGSTNF